MTNPERMRELELIDARKAIAQLEDEWQRLNHDRAKLVRRMEANAIEQQRLGRIIEELEGGDDELDEDTDDEPKF